MQVMYLGTLKVSKKSSKLTLNNGKQSSYEEFSLQKGPKNAPIRSKSVTFCNYGKHLWY